MPPERVRDILAKYIAERALMGERDPETLRDGALECLSLMARSGVFSGASARRIEFVPGDRPAVFEPRPPGQRGLC